MNSYQEDTRPSKPRVGGSNPSGRTEFPSENTEASGRTGSKEVGQSPHSVPEIAARPLDERPASGGSRSTDTFYAVVTTGAEPYALPFASATTPEGARAAYRAVTGDDLPPHMRVVRVTASWEVAK